MNRVSSIPSPRVGIRWRGKLHPALALALRGEEACLVLPDAPPQGTELEVVLDWPGGEVTECRGRLREVAFDGRIARVDIQKVAGAWVPFLRYLGAQASA